MLDLTTKTIAELIDPKGFDCECGKKHAVSIKYVKTGRGVINCVPEMIAALGAKKPFVLCDKNTYRAAGEKVCAILKDAGIEYGCYVIPGERISPAEWEIGSLIMHFDPRCDMLLAIGSGVINDICKVAGHALRLPSAVVGTGPSMDGYASTSSAWRSPM